MVRELSPWFMFFSTFRYQPLLGWVLAIAAGGASLEALSSDYQMQLPDNSTRPFVAPEIWTTPMMDWQLNEGRVELLQGGRNKDFQILTHQLSKEDGTLRMSTRLGLLASPKNSNEIGSAGFKFAVTGAMPDEYRSGLFSSRGLRAGVTTEGKLFVGSQFSESAIDPSLLNDLTLTLEAVFEGSQAVVFIVAKSSLDGLALAQFQAVVEKNPMQGNLGLFCDPLSGPGQKNPPANSLTRFWFSDWRISGDKVVANESQVFGPVLWSQYTTHKGVMKMTAHIAPMESESSEPARLEFWQDGSWKVVQSADIDPLSRTAHFRVEDWDHQSEKRYRVALNWQDSDGIATSDWEGVIRKDPVDQSIVRLAALSCMVDYAFPNQYVAENILAQDPDVVFFAGDQIYEGVAGFGVVRTNSEDDIERATLNYLSKYWLFGWSFREALKGRPSVIIPDDHDVFHGNIWGKGGAAMPAGGSTSSTGGYNMHWKWINMVQRTQVSHLPDPYDPTPALQVITVYYTDLNVGGVSMAILEDRKFKSAPGDALEEPVGNSSRLDHVVDEDFDTSKIDKPGLKLLGDRQLKFLNEWNQDFDNAVFKAVLSQTPLGAVATTHGGPNGRLAADLDANGWPQTGRNTALKAIRKAHAIMIHGDQHLASLVHHGVDEWGDAGWSYTAPGIANGYKRIWDPLQSGRNRAPGAPDYTGEFLDGFGNKVTVWAVNNRIDTIDPSFRLNSASMVDRLNSTGSGYGIIEFDKDKLEIVVESWPVYEKWVAGKTTQQHEGWPKTLPLASQYARRATDYLPDAQIPNGKLGILKVYDTCSGELVYARAVKGSCFRPKIFNADRSYRVEIE